LLAPGPDSCRQLVLPFPIIDNDDLAKIIHINDDNTHPHLAAVVISGLYRVADGGAGLRSALDDVRAEVTEAIINGARIIVLSDRNSDEVFAPIPSLLLTSAVHHHLIREKRRTQVGMVVECGDAREVHHMALLVALHGEDSLVAPAVAVVLDGLLKGPMQALETVFEDVVEAE
jgi:glutamate synthase (NADPH/NADH) large chain